jgi:hypothetical protein
MGTLKRKVEIMKKEDEAKIIKVLDGLVQGWRKADATLLKSLYDPEYPDLSFLVPENPRPIFGLASLSNYYKKLVKVFPDVKVKPENIKIVPLAGRDDLAHLFCDLPCYVKMPEWKPEGFYAKDWFVYSRLTLVLRRKGRDWYIVHYHESIAWTPPVGGKWQQPV